MTTATAYTYDPAGRLTDVTVDGTLVAHYEYDANGNRLSVFRPSATVTGSYDAQDRLTAYGAFTFTYTANGELQTATEGGRTTTYTYDPLGNLVSVTLPNGTVVEYVIDGLNRRTGKKVNGTLTQAFLYRNQLNPVAELDGAGNVVARFVYGTRANVPDYVIKGATTYRILTGHLGSPRLIVDTSTGAIAQRLAHDEFGQVTLDTNPGFQPFGFAGGLYDPDTQLVRFGARDYDPFTGRWTTKDPIRFAGAEPNLYGYVLNDPVSFIDTDGLDVIFLGIGFSAFIGESPDKIGRGIGKQVTLGIALETSTWTLKPYKSVGVADPTNPEDQVAGFNFGIGGVLGSVEGCLKDFFGEATEETLTLGPLGFTKIRTASGKEGIATAGGGRGIGLSGTTIRTFTSPLALPSISELGREIPPFGP